VIDDGNPDIEVDELMAKIHEQIAAHNVPSLLAGYGGVGADITTLVARIEESLVAAESSSQVRTSLGRSRRFLRRTPMLEDLALRVLAFLFRDQRNVNAALVEALRTSLQLNVRLCENIDRIKLRIEALER